MVETGPKAGAVTGPKAGAVTGPVVKNGAVETGVVKAGSMVETGGVALL